MLKQQNKLVDRWLFFGVFAIGMPSLLDSMFNIDAPVMDTWWREWSPYLVPFQMAAALVLWYRASATATRGDTVAVGD